MAFLLSSHTRDYFPPHGLDFQDRVSGPAMAAKRLPKTAIMCDSEVVKCEGYIPPKKKPMTHSLDSLFIMHMRDSDAEPIEVRTCVCIVVC